MQKLSLEIYSRSRVLYMLMYYLICLNEIISYVLLRDGVDTCCSQSNDVSYNAMVINI